MEKVLVTASSSFRDYELVLRTLEETLENDSVKVQPEGGPNGSRPIVFTRDRKVDVGIYDTLSSKNFRVIPFRARWKENKEDAGILRNKAVFMHGISKAIVFTGKDLPENEGLAHIQHLCETHNVPLKIVGRPLPSSKPNGVPNGFVETMEQSDDPSRMKTIVKRIKKEYYENAYTKPVDDTPRKRVIVKRKKKTEPRSGKTLTEEPLG